MSLPLEAQKLKDGRDHHLWWWAAALIFLIYGLCAVLFIPQFFSKGFFITVLFFPFWPAAFAAALSLLIINFYQLAKQGSIFVWSCLFALPILALSYVLTFLLVVFVEHLDHSTFFVALEVLLGAGVAYWCFCAPDAIKRLMANVFMIATLTLLGMNFWTTYHSVTSCPTDTEQHHISADTFFYEVSFLREPKVFFSHLTGKNYATCQWLREPLLNKE